jgi:hypothetical protein
MLTAESGTPAGRAAACTAPQPHRYPAHQVIEHP